MGKLKEFFLGSREQQIDFAAINAIELSLDEERHYYLSKEWSDGKRSPLNETIKEWEHLDKPSKKQ